MAARQLEYAKIDDGDQGDVRGDDVGVEASQSLMGNEQENWKERQAANNARRGRWRRCLTAVFSLQGLLNTLLLFVILGLLVDRRWHKQRHGHFEGNGDITGFAPRFAQQIQTFVPDMAFVPENGSEFFTEEVKKKWLGMVPKGLGYVQVDDPSDYDNLPHPLKGYSNTVFTTSMTHQLHCLYNIAEVYSGLISDPSKVPSQIQGHIPHCFEYLRQSIMCCADTALEGQHTTFPKAVQGSDGWDAKHVCKDYDAVYKHLERKRADNRVWI